MKTIEQIVMIFYVLLSVFVYFNAQDLINDLKEENIFLKTTNARLLSTLEITAGMRNGSYD